MAAVQQDLEVIKGKTFAASFGWAQGKFAWGLITGIAKTAPVSITVPGHDLKSDWPYWISGLKKPACLNNWTDPCGSDSPDAGSPYMAEVVDADTLEINDLNGLEFETYAGGGVIRYYARADITGYEALMQVRASASSDAVLFEASSAGIDPLITVDPVTATFGLNIPADAFDAATFRDAQYEIEITAPTGEKYRLAYGVLSLGREIVK